MKQQSTYSNFHLTKKLSEDRTIIYKAKSATVKKTKLIVKVYLHHRNEPKEEFLNEINFVGLHHPHIAAPQYYNKDYALKVGLQQQEEVHTSITVSDYIPNGDLETALVDKNIAFSEMMIRTYFHQLIDALSYLHSQGVAHLDIKPDNILFGENFELKLIDFDLSYKRGAKCSHGRGSADFRAPELYQNEVVDDLFQCDIYSAGILLFYMKSGGQLPFEEKEGDKETDLLVHSLNKRSTYFWLRQNELLEKSDHFWSKSFRELFEGMCNSDPKKRITLEGIKKSQWYNKPIFQKDELKTMMKVPYEQ